MAIFVYLVCLLTWQIDFLILRFWIVLAMQPDRQEALLGYSERLAKLVACVCLEKYRHPGL